MPPPYRVNAAIVPSAGRCEFHPETVKPTFPVSRSPSTTGRGGPTNAAVSSWVTAKLVPFCTPRPIRVPSIWNGWIGYPSRSPKSPLIAINAPCARPITLGRANLPIVGPPAPRSIVVARAGSRRTTCTTTGPGRCSMRW